jgi:hypothetical protein
VPVPFFNGLFRVATQDDNVVSVGGERARQQSADVPAASGDDDFHCVASNYAVWKARRINRKATRRLTLFRGIGEVTLARLAENGKTWPLKVMAMAPETHSLRRQTREIPAAPWQYPLESQSVDAINSHRAFSDTTLGRTDDFALRSEGRAPRGSARDSPPVVGESRFDP